MTDAALRQAFEETDAACRGFSPPTCRLHYLRALALLALGDAAAARRDLDRALAGPSDLDMLALRLRLDPDLDVARAIFSSADAGDGLARRAAALILGSDPLALRAVRTQVGVDVLVACRAGATPTVDIDGAALALEEVPGDRAAGAALYRTRHAVPPTASPRVGAAAGLHRARVDLPPRAMATARPPSRPGVVSVVVPVHGGRAATRSCLAALARQRCRRRLDVVVVDDACPDRDLAAEVAATAARAGWRHLRNGSNLGFAAAVGRGAALAEGGHILLLNADAVLPPGAIDRLLAAADLPGVGIAVPLSNDGGFASFPVMRRANPAPGDGEARRIDAAAQRAAGDADAPRAIDIPAGTASCMMVTGPCWDALGGLDLGYGRGYFEDVDLCLRARRIGFRTVLASDVYVRHLGGQSFGSAKGALVAENARLLVERFPGYEAEWTAFAEGDPLAAARARLERLLPPSGPVHLVAGRRAQASAIEDADAAGAPRGMGRLVLEEASGGGLRLGAADGGVPQNLCFAPHERADWASYMRALSIVSLHLVDPSDGLLRDLDALVPQSAAVSATVTGPRGLRLLGRRSGLLARARVAALDGMARAALGEDVAPLASPLAAPIATPEAPARRPPRLAALVPRPTVRVDRLLLALDRRVRAGGGEVVVLGESLGARARPAASGRMDRGDYPDAIRHRGVTHLLLPDVDAPFRLVEDLRRASPLPSAYVDWAPGRHRAAPGDLALPMDGTDAERVSAVADWCLATRPVAGGPGDPARAGGRA